MDPLVSVVLPTYNHARYLKRAIQSILDQSYMNWELIIIDDYSKENSFTCSIVIRAIESDKSDED